MQRTFLYALVGISYFSVVALILNAPSRTPQEAVALSPPLEAASTRVSIEESQSPRLEVMREIILPSPLSEVPPRAIASGEDAMILPPDSTAEIAKLKAEVARLSYELTCCEYPEDTPYGAFIRSPEAKRFSDEEKANVRSLLEEIPVKLTGAEADWIGKHRSELMIPGTDYLTNVVRYLGTERILREVGSDPVKLGKLKEAFGDAMFEQFFSVSR
jgi:hypothetical protein